MLIRLHAFYPQARGAFTGYEIRRYSTDPSMGGAYLAFGPGQISKFWRLWERPVQRVAFAGEHTDTLYPGTLEGALRTGQRAASQVEDLAAGKSFEPEKVLPVAAAAAGAGAVAAKKGNFFTNLFGGSDDEKKPAPVKAPEPVAPPAPCSCSCAGRCASPGRSSEACNTGESRAGQESSGEETGGQDRGEKSPGQGACQEGRTG